MGWRWLVGEIDVPRPRQNGLLEQGLHILVPAGSALVAGELENRVDGAEPIGQEYRTQNYLRRIVALTGADAKREQLCPRCRAKLNFLCAMDM